ncbi:MAG TPA: hypothetical protein VGF93_05035 [Solirubrobacteraceae bacterium]|jgi:hypothetical protein
MYVCDEVPTTATRGELRRVDLPPAARALSTLPRIDYADAFVVEIGSPPERTAEQWARAVLEELPLALRIKLVLGWSALGLRLGSPVSDRFVLGWNVAHSDADYTLLSAGSRFGLAGELLFKPEGSQLLFATFVRQQGVFAHAVWPRIVPQHVRVVRHVLRRASLR